jgi:hypothetical protein
VCFAGAGDAVGEQEAVLLVQKISDERQANLESIL